MKILLLLLLISCGKNELTDFIQGNEFNTQKREREFFLKLILYSTNMLTNLKEFILN